MTDLIVYDDTHSGPRWTYGLTHRPLAAFAIPNGWIIQSDRVHPDYRYGTVDYPRALTADEVASYELVLVGPLEPLDATVDEGERRIACPCGGDDPSCRACDIEGTIPGDCQRCHAALATDTATMTDRGDVLCAACFSGYLDALGVANALLDRFLTSDPQDRTYDVTITMPLRSADYRPWTRDPQSAEDLVWAMIRGNADWPDDDLIAVSLTVQP